MITSCAPMPFILSNSPSPCRSSSPSTCSAGNLFGTTRTSQPGPLAAPPLRRYDSTSRGVYSSWPSQKGHTMPSMGSRCSTRKASGRLRRSVEMITQRPVMGSLRSSGISGVEGIPDDLHVRRVLIEPHGDHVESAGNRAHAVAGQVIVGDGDYLTPLPPCDGVGPVAALAAAPGLHLDEHQAAAVHGDDVDFAEGH